MIENKGRKEDGDEGKFEGWKEDKRKENIGRMDEGRVREGSKVGRKEGCDEEYE